jgi:hypothetical protein
LPERVHQDDHSRERPHQRVAEQERHSGEKAARLLRRLGPLARGDEQEHGHERERERRRVDVEDVRRAERRDQEAGERRTEQGARLPRALEHTVGLGDRLLVVAEQLRQDHPLRREVGRVEAAECGDEEEQQGKREQVGGVKDRQRRHQRHSRQIRPQHGQPRPDPRDERPARHSEQRRRQELDGEDNAHLRRRPGRHEHEPRQSQERHLRAGARDELCGEQREQRSVAQNHAGCGSGTAPRARSDAAATPSIATVCTAAKPTNTGRAP